jgi:hypothetical protein
MHAHAELLIPLPELSHAALEARLEDVLPGVTWELGGRFRGAHSAEGIQPDAGVTERELGGLILRCTAGLSNLEAIGRFRLAHEADLLWLDDERARDYLTAGAEPSEWLLYDAEVDELITISREQASKLDPAGLALATLDWD